MNRTIHKDRKQPLSFGVALIASLILMSFPADAHRSGCHRWHSCVSDSGSYVCGDLGKCSQCPDNQYCEAGKPRTANVLPSTKVPKTIPKQSSRTQKTSQPLAKEKQIFSIGTGFVFGSSGYILTNYHVVRGAKTITIKFQNGERVTAELITKDSQNDIAYLKPKSIPNIRTMNLSLADSSSVRLGDKVFTLGYPIATVLGENLKYSEGVINSLSGVGDDPKVFQISIPTQSGNSGGPLFNEHGEVIGIVSSSLDVVKTQQVMGITPQNVNFAIKSSHVKNMLAMLPKNLISPTDLSLVQNKSESSISNFGQQVENNKVQIKVYFTSTV